VLDGQFLCLLTQRQHILIHLALDHLNLLVSQFVLEILSDYIYHILHVCDGTASIGTSLNVAACVRQGKARYSRWLAQVQQSIL
jgi:hypothetical protein